MAQPRMRLFELTLHTHLWGSEELPETFEDWLRRMFGDEAVDQMGASATSLEGVKELRYPLSEDVVEKRKADDRRYW